jgi:hypothetical protein
MNKLVEAAILSNRALRQRGKIPHELPRMTKTLSPGTNLLQTSREVARRVIDGTENPSPPGKILLADLWPDNKAARLWMSMAKCECVRDQVRDFTFPAFKKWEPLERQSCPNFYWPARRSSDLGMGMTRHRISFADVSE